MTKRRRKLRSLVAKEAAPQEPKYSLPIFIALILSGITIAIYYSGINTTMLYNDFMSTYRKQYSLIVYGEDYCIPIINTSKLHAEVSKEVLNQQAALHNFEFLLQGDSRFTAIAIAGSSGVGKSLFAQTLQQHFSWKENVQIYSWSSFRTPNQKRHVLFFLKNLSECGRNLIIIDNLLAEDKDFVQEYNRYSMKYVKEATVNLIIVYIFNVISYSNEQRKHYSDTIKVLQRLENVQFIKFRQFNSNDLKNCVRHETKHFNLTLDDVGFKEVIKSIDPERSGCKNVRSKVLMYGNQIQMG